MNSGTWAKVCVKLAADPAIDADSNDTALHESQRKAVRNAKRCPSRTSVGSKRRRCSGHGSQTATRRGALFTPEVRQATLALLPTLRRAGVVRQPVRPDGPLIRALAASLHMDIEGVEREDAQALMSTESILVVLRLCYINRVQLRLQLRDETALQLLPKFC